METSSKKDRLRDAIQALDAIRAIVKSGPVSKELESELKRRQTVVQCIQEEWDPSECKRHDECWCQSCDCEEKE